MLIEIYTADGCTHCKTTKDLLESRNLTYIEHKVDVEITREEVKKLFPQARMLPVVLVDGNYIESPESLQLLLG